MSFRKSLITILCSFIIPGVYYNTFYNAEKAFDDAVKLIEQASLVEQDTVSPQAKKMLGKAIDNSNIVINDYPNSKYVDDAFFMIGRASFLRSETAMAERFFNRLRLEYPNSKFNIESTIWLARTYIKMGLFDKAESIFKNLESSKIKDKPILAFFYLVKAEMALEKSSYKDVYIFYEKSANFSDSNSKKTYIYNRLAKIAKTNNNLDRLVIYLDYLFKFGTTDIRIDARFDWIKYQRALNNYELIITEIQNLLILTEFQSKILQLQIELGKVYRDMNLFKNAKEIFNNIVENNSRRNETSEAYYHLGMMSLFEDFNIELATEYFDKSITEKSRSEYGKKSNDFLSIIDEYKILIEKFNISNKQYESINPDSTYIDLIDDEDDSNISNSPDYLLLEIAEMLLYDFGHIDLAIQKLKDLIKQFPDSNKIIQAKNMLAYYNSESSNENLKNTKINMVEEYVEIDSVLILKDQAWNQFDLSIDKGLKNFKLISDNFNDPESAYLVAFIYDQYLYDIDNAILYYRSFLDRFPDYQSAEIASQRLAVIEESVKHQLDVMNHKFIYDKSLSFLSDNQLDSTIHTLNKIQDSNYETPFKVVANQLLNKINLLLDINFKINEQQIEKDSINYLEIVDSLFYFKSQVFNDLGNLDSCLYYLKFLSSNATNAKFKTLSEISISNFIESSNLDTYQDSTVVIDSSLIIYNSEFHIFDISHDFEIDDTMHNKINSVFSTFLDTNRMVLDSAEWIDSIEIKSLDSMEVVKNSLIDPKIEDDSLGISLLDSNLISSDIQNLVMFNQEETIDIANKMESDSIIVNYLIKKNETLFSISNKFYNEYNNWNEIYKLNKEILINPSYLVPYNRINILLPKNQSDSLVVSLEFDEYIVKEHDSLWKIAKEQYGDPLAWIIIYKDNLRTIGFLPDEISAGMRFNIRRNIFSLYITPL